MGSMTKILLLVISLGGPTLERLKKVLVENKDTIDENVQPYLKGLLKKNFGFEDDYADWLPKHLQHLTQGSIDILKDLNPKEFEHVRYSTVVSVFGDKSRKIFDTNIRSIEMFFNRKRRGILEKAVLAS